MKLFNIICLSFALSACGGGGSSSSGGATDDTKEFKYTTSSSAINIDSEETYDIKVTGSSNTITAAKNQQIRNVKITGSNNIFQIDEESTVELLDITGSDNTIITPNGSIKDFDFTGSGNQFYDL